MSDHYFRNHPSYKYEENLSFRDSLVIKYRYDLKDYLDFIKEGNVLEIGTGIGNFTYFCHKIGVNSYTGIDIDDYFFEYHKKDFPRYSFLKNRFQDYLGGNKKFDVIFTSHVFEHLDVKERTEIIQCIYDSLEDGGIWINYMPNADSSLLVGFGRWGDITHTTIYNKTSFVQLINGSGKTFTSIRHLNFFIGYNFFKRSIHKFFLLFTKLYYLGMGSNFPEIYTWEIISILKK